MSWLFFALVSTLSWGLADLFYKKGTDEDDRDSHLKIAVAVGLVMGLAALVILPFTEGGKSLPALGMNALRYSPASLSYILSMIIGYAGLRYLELSVVSPVQNASGAFSVVAMFVFFLATGRISGFWEAFSLLDVIGTVLIAAGIILLAVFERRIAAKAEDGTAAQNEATKKYRFGALALLFPLLYCVFDTVGTAADGIILDGEAGLGLGEWEVLVLYGLTFFLAGVICYMILWVKNRKPYNPFGKKELPKLIAALAEEFGQVFYVFAMARKPMLAAPVVASYCIVSVLLSRIFLKEKLEKSRLLCILSVILGIVILGISEGLGEA